MVQITYLNKISSWEQNIWFWGAGGVGIWLVTLRELVLWCGALGGGCFGAVDFYLECWLGLGKKGALGRESFGGVGIISLDATEWMGWKE